MSICLCDISALEAIRSSGKLVGELLDHPRTSSLDGCRAPSAAELDDLLVGLGVRTRPVHVLVSRGGPTRLRSGVVVHSRGEALLHATLIRYSSGVLIATPELVVCQLAMRADFDVVDLASVITELCGTYLLDPDDNSWKGFVNIDKPVATMAKLRAVSKSLGKTHGSAKLARALDASCPLSHSPMETVLALLLGMPRKMGGLGIKGLELNYPVSSGGVHAVIDAAIPSCKVGLEYKGRACHAIEQSGRDDRRQNGLAGLGWTILNVWSEDLKSDLLFGRLQDSLFRAMGKRFRPVDGFAAAQWRLRHRLVPGHR